MVDEFELVDEVAEEFLMFSQLEVQHALQEDLEL
jgi:hypothetical protein